jgi:hypothetical protein
MEIIQVTVTERRVKYGRLGWSGHVGRMRKTRNICRILVGNPLGAHLLGRRRRKRKWEDIIKMDDANWVHVAQDRVHWRALVNTVMNIRVT